VSHADVTVALRTLVDVMEREGYTCSRYAEGLRDGSIEESDQPWAALRLAWRALGKMPHA
jgi:hypothetical protein